MNLAEFPHLRTVIYVAESSVHGKGVFAKREISRGEPIGEYKGPQARRNGSHVLWVSESEGRSGRNALRFLNHSRRPNAEFDGYVLYARRRIRPDEEITFDYGDSSFEFY
ncbi:MAG: SET domain-containing protein [Myxococcales bacterium FL481]|nr:MAG: SET domain-containing protein [Myxococcales bacterium FL481]